MTGTFLVCPDGANFSVDSSERPRCRDAATNSVSAWELHHTDEIIDTGLTAEDYDTLWAACVLFLILGVGIKILKSIFTPNRG